MAEREASSGSLKPRWSSSKPCCPPQRNLASALRVPGVILLCVQYFFWSFGVYGLVLWIPEMIRSGSARGIETIGLLSAAPFLLAVVLMLLVAYFSDRALNRKIFVWPFLLLSGVALFSSYATAGNHFWLAYVSLIVAGGAMYAPYGPFFAIVPEMLPKTVAGEVMALINTLRSAGRIRRHMAGGLAAGPDEHRQCPRRAS
jgi:MFS family permease